MRPSPANPMAASISCRQPFTYHVEDYVRVLSDVALLLESQLEVRQGDLCRQYKVMAMH